MVSPIRTRAVSVGEDMKGKEILFIGGGNVHIVSRNNMFQKQRGAGLVVRSGKASA